MPAKRFVADLAAAPARFHLGVLTLMLVELLLTGCADRYLRSCAASFIIIGPGKLSFDCQGLTTPAPPGSGPPAMPEPDAVPGG